MIIAAVVTDGDIAALREGKHGLFYDRVGQEWDATVFKIIDNPISIRQAFWSPYRKLGRFIEKTIEKNASEKDDKVNADLTAKVAAPGEEKKAPFDIAKYAGIFAAVGIALGAIGVAIGSIAKSLSGFVWWQWLILIAAILLVISGPAMILAWIKLRKRSLSPLLNANGWAINAAAKVNITFGATLTEIGKTPVKADPDPYADKTPWWKKLIGWLIVLGIIFWICYSQNWIEKWTGDSRWHHEKKSKTEQVEEAPAPAEDAEAMLILTSQEFEA